MNKARLIKRRCTKPTRQVSERMKKVRSKGTKLEKAMESIFKNLSIKYEVQPKVHGNPDFRIKNTNILIFCDSSFWHGRRKKEVSGKAFKKNKEFWVEKLNYNKKRDARNNRILRREGWSVHRFWDTDILKNRKKVINRLRRILNA